MTDYWHGGDSPIQESPTKPCKQSVWSVSVPGFPGNRKVPTRKLGPYETALSAPDILTYIDKESFDRLADRVREERGALPSTKKDDDV